MPSSLLDFTQVKYIFLQSVYKQSLGSALFTCYETILFSVLLQNLHIYPFFDRLLAFYQIIFNYFLLKMLFPIFHYYKESMNIFTGRSFSLTSLLRIRKEKFLDLRLWSVFWLLIFIANFISKMNVWIYSAINFEWIFSFIQSHLHWIFFTLKIVSNLTDMLMASDYFNFYVFADKIV